ncbi:MAG: hypothetical protein LBU29_04585 [Endomicrobium sp.]|jgi:lipoate-protein ligase A|nr:hypothetical protein [Endomicrobium sp.]
MLIWINDIPRDAVTNMALDELLFNKYNGEPILRIYYWDSQYTTIGYFQKAKDIASGGFVRRFTGGLTVNHCNDISYSFVASSKNWCVYDQNMTYRNIHFAVQKSLQLFGINSEILTRKASDVNNICVETFCENDLISNDKKIVGSCLRRRGNKLIVQGSIYVNLSYSHREKFSEEFAKCVCQFLKTKIKIYNFCDDDIESSKKIADKKYLNFEWNNKF